MSGAALRVISAPATAFAGEAEAVPLPPLVTVTVCSVGAGGVSSSKIALTSTLLSGIAVDGDAFAIHSPNAADGCAAALGESGDLTAGDADVAGAADACRAAFSDRMDDAVGDGDAALLFAFVANGGVIAICRGFYISAIDGNVHFRRVVNSGSADAKAISLGRCLDSTAVDGDAAALKRADPVSGNRV